MAREGVLSLWTCKCGLIPRGSEKTLNNCCIIFMKEAMGLLRTTGTNRKTNKPFDH